MNKKPVLVVLAAGMGSRYGGLKQIDPVGSQGEAILDYPCLMPTKQALKPQSLLSKRPSEKTLWPP